MQPVTVHVFLFRFCGKAASSTGSFPTWEPEAAFAEYSPMDEVLAAFRKRRRKEGKPKQKQKQKQGGDNGGAAATAAEESAVLRSSDGAVDGGVVYTWPIYCRCLLSFFAFSLLLNESSIRRSEGAGGAGSR